MKITRNTEWSFQWVLISVYIQFVIKQLHIDSYCIAGCGPYAGSILAVAVCPGVGPMPRIADFMITSHGLCGLRVPYALGGWSRVAGPCFARGRCRLRYGRPMREYRVCGGFVDDHRITKGRRVLTQAIRPVLQNLEYLWENERKSEWPKRDSNPVHRLDTP